MSTLRHGDRNQAVLALQRALNAGGAGLFADGHYGDATEAAVREFQRRAGLVVDGIAGAETQAAIAGADCTRLLTQADIEAAAAKLGVPVAAVLAVNEVESAGSGFLDNGMPKILFERHVFARQLKAAGHDIDALTARYPQLVNTRAGGYIGGVAEHQRLAQARQIDKACALESASWGLFQIMAYHWQSLGYASAQEFTTRMARSEGEQLDAFVRFILADAELLKSLRSRKWPQFARRFNGPEYARHCYDIRLARAFNRHASIHLPATA